MQKPIQLLRSFALGLYVLCLLSASGCSDSAHSVSLGSTSDASATGGTNAGDSGRPQTIGDAGSVGDTGVGGAAEGRADGGPSGDAATRTDADASVITGVRKGPPPVRLGTAGSYVLLAKSAISTVPASVVTGDVGISPAAASYLTGFALTKVGTYWTSPQVTGHVLAADGDPPTPSDLTTAVANMETAYTDAAGRADPDVSNLGSGAIGGMTLAPGLYKWGSAVTVASAITLLGGPEDTWIFQISGDLTLSSATRMTLAGGAQAKNIVWQVAGVVALGTSAHAEGIMLAKTAIALGTSASVNGRLLAQTSVDIDGSTVTKPAD